METIHVSGATGFLGRAICSHFLNRGFRVNALVRPQSRSKITLLSRFDLLQVTEIDLMSPSSFEFKIEKGDLLIHTAAVNPPIENQDIEELVRVNIQYGIKLMQQASLGGGRFLNIGTNWQHYKNMPYSPVSIYAASKQAHLAFQQYFTEVEGLSARSLELSDTYGPNDPRDKLIPLLLSPTMCEWPLELTGGTQLIDLVHIDDVVEAINLINQNWDSPFLKMQMSLTSGELLSIKALVKECGIIRGHEIPVKWGSKQSLYARQMHESWAFHEVPWQWAPKISLKKGLNEVYQEMKNKVQRN